MARRFRIIRNVIEQGFEGMWRNRGMGVASVSSISAVLIILGIVLVLILNINNVAVQTKSRFDEIQIYLEDGIKPESLEVIESKMREDKRIVSYEFESDKEALEKFKEDWEDDAYIFEGLEEDNPLPNSFILKVKEVEDAEGVVEEFKDLDGIERIPYFKEEVDKLMKIAYYIRIGGIVVIAVLVFVSIFIISNTIKITVAAREQEVSIMKYVGATNSYIRGPFVIEGVLFGLLASILSILIVKFGYGYIFKAMKDSMYTFSSSYLVKPGTIMKDIVIIFISIGAGIGALGSIVSLRRFLRV